jgi:hypothetical protein
MSGCCSGKTGALIVEMMGASEIVLENPEHDFPQRFPDEGAGLPVGR